MNNIIKFAILGVVILTISGCVQLPAEKEQITTPSNKNLQAKTIDASAIKLTIKQSGYCRVLAPQEWFIISNQQGSGVDVFSPDKSMHAGWGITFVYNYMYPTGDDFLNTWMPLAGFPGFSMGNPSDMGYGFIKRDFTASNNKKGFLFYKKYDSPELGGYVMSVYMADTDSGIWESHGAIPSYSAISIRCVTQLRPTTSNIDVKSSNPGSSSDNPEVSLSDKWQEAIMGYENVYSPTTGEHWEAPLNSKWESGPEGSGYYRYLPGGGYEKLEHGFGSYQ